MTKELGDALKSVGDAYVRDNPVTAAELRAGLQRRRRKRRAFEVAGGLTVAAAAALALLFFSGTQPSERLPSAGQGLTVDSRIALPSSPEQIAAREGMAWVTMPAISTVAGVSRDAGRPLWQQQIEGELGDIVATGDGVWLTAGDTILELDRRTGALVKGPFPVGGRPTRLTVGTRAARVTVPDGVVRVDLDTGEIFKIFEGPVIDIAMGKRAFWVLAADGVLQAIDPDSGLDAGMADVALSETGEITFLRGAIWYGSGGTELVRIDESSGSVTARSTLPGPYVDIDADASGLWVLTRTGRLGAVHELDPVHGTALGTSLDLDEDPQDLSTDGVGFWVATADGEEAVHVVSP